MSLLFTLITIQTYIITIYAEIPIEQSPSVNWSASTSFNLIVSYDPSLTVPYDSSKSLSNLFEDRFPLFLITATGDRITINLDFSNDPLYDDFSYESDFGVAK